MRTFTVNFDATDTNNGAILNITITATDPRNDWHIKHVKRGDKIRFNYAGTSYTGVNITKGGQPNTTLLNTTNPVAFNTDHTIHQSAVLANDYGFLLNGLTILPPDSGGIVVGS